MADTKIEWATKVWNPVTGCDPVGAGCANCYARREWQRKKANPKSKKYFGREFDDVQCHEQTLRDPLAWKTPQKVFVDSMGDLFHPSVPDDFIRRVFGTMLLADDHFYIVLTKRAARMKEFIDDYIAGSVVEGLRILDGDPITFERVFAHVAFGVSIWDQPSANEFVPILLSTRAAIRVASAEPMLGAIDLRSLRIEVRYEGREAINCDALTGERFARLCTRDGGYIGTEPRSSGTHLDQVICGGESGPGARPMHPDWARSLRDQCTDAGVAFFFKQWGEWTAETVPGVEVEMSSLAKNQCVAMGDGETNHTRYTRVGKRAAGRLLDGREWSEYPEACGL